MSIYPSSTSARVYPLFLNPELPVPIPQYLSMSVSTPLPSIRRAASSPSGLPHLKYLSISRIFLLPIPVPEATTKVDDTSTPTPITSRVNTLFVQLGDQNREVVNKDNMLYNLT